MKKIKKNQYIKLELLCFSVMFLGIFIRVLFYSYDRPFWNDECALALNLVNFNVFNCFSSLNFGQAAPPLFLVASGIFAKNFSNVELSLRFIPLLSSIISIFVFYNLSKQILNKKITIFLAMLLFCFNYRLIYYSQEFKQYSSDILIFLCILTSYFYLGFRESNFKKLLSVGLAYALSIWFSFTSVFAICTVFLILMFKNIKLYKKLAFLFIPILISFLCFYFNQHYLTISTFFHNYWAAGFIRHDFSNFFLLLFEYFKYSFSSLFVFIFFMVGLILKLKDVKNEKSLILIIPIVLAIILSYFSVYPLCSRVALYLIPICILFAVQVVDYINIKNKSINYILYGVIIFLISIISVNQSLDNVIFKNYEYEDIIFPLNKAKKLMKTCDILYIPDGSVISYDFYETNYKFENTIIENQRIYDSKEYLKLLDKLPKNKTYYYIYCHFPNKQQRLYDIYLWAKQKKNFKIYVDKHFNGLIIFTQ